MGLKPFLCGSGRCLFIVLIALSSLTGCESFQKKFVRKKAYERPSPIISFQDYTYAMTPLERYRKHYAIFDYWNSQLLDELGNNTMNSKRVGHACSESLQELKVMRSLLKEPVASDLNGILDARQRLDNQIKAGLLNKSQVAITKRDLEMQTRDIHNRFYWREIESHLQESEKSEPVPSGS